MLASHAAAKNVGAGFATLAHTRTRLAAALLSRLSRRFTAALMSSLVRRLAAALMSSPVKRMGAADTDLVACRGADDLDRRGAFFLYASTE